MTFQNDSGVVYPQPLRNSDSTALTMIVLEDQVVKMMLFQRPVSFRERNDEGRWSICNWVELLLQIPAMLLSLVMTMTKIYIFNNNNNIVSNCIFVY